MSRAGRRTAGRGAAMPGVLVAAAFLAAFTATPLRGQVPEAAASAAAETITVQDLRRRLEVIAHDSMRGRATPSPELMETARYVADEFAALGLRPGAQDGWLQEYPLSTLRPADPDDHLVSFSGPGGSRDLRFDADYLAQYDAESAAGEGELVVYEVGGSETDETDVDGRVVVVRVTMENLQQVFGGGLGNMVEGEPAGFLLVLDVPDAFFDRLRRFLVGGRTIVGETPETSVPVVYADHSRLPSDVASLLETPGHHPEWSAQLQTRAEVEVASAPNTIGILEGSDPELADEFVLFSAHMDHVGVDPDAGPGEDAIYNGADDDGSGTVTVIELAEAFASLETRPRRSLVFLAVSGEERGLLGSAYYADNPTVPLEATVANLNMDMIGRNWKDTIVAIGKAESTLGPLVESVAASRPELDMAVIDDPWPEEGFYTRSDHYNFARRGVPILFFFSGVHEDYHQVGDEIEEIDFEKLARIGRLVFYTGLAVADADEPPMWDADAYARVVDRPVREAEGAGGSR